MSEVPVAYCLACGLRVYLVQDRAGEQFYVTSGVRKVIEARGRWGERWCRA